MTPETQTQTRLTDYQPYGFSIESVELSFALNPKTTRVTSRLSVVKKGPDKDMFLDGDSLKLVKLSINGKPLNNINYILSSTGLTLKNTPDEFSLEIITDIHPDQNSNLMGLYVSGGRFCTQCEAEGFRRITYFPDRPDVLSTYTVRIEADKKTYPTLLANGNMIETGQLGETQHYAIWEDPFPKPCYLFALVAGQFDSLGDSFQTLSGREIRIDIFVDPGDAPRAHYAMDALKRAMKWDEERFGREYDLDRFMIVAVRDFNFGAMENKGLNIFNSALLLADQATATSLDFERIESVVAHEYFHNWSGNRVTCRDWFQLCLKEGFTVYRDQEFSADQRGPALCRIKSVKMLRERQFPEDAGPLAHPVRPEAYVKIDNFYTATIYEKGAELVRMLHTMLGDKAFRAGCDLYFETYDGTAATVEDFLSCFETAGGRDLSHFAKWYAQAGTPKISIKSGYDAKTQTFSVDLQQSHPPTPGQADKHPLIIPVKMGLVLPDGRNMAETTFILDAPTARYRFENIPEKPALSVFRNFSAPVLIEYQRSLEDTLLLMRADEDMFARLDAGQSLIKTLIATLAEALQTGTPAFEQKALTGYLNAIGKTLQDQNISPSLKALALELPTRHAVLQTLWEDSLWEDSLWEERRQGTDPLAVNAALKLVRQALAKENLALLEDLYAQTALQPDFSPDAKSAGIRALANACLSLLSEIPGRVHLNRAVRHYELANNMTDEYTALLVLVRQGGKRALMSLARFYDKWKDNPLVLDKWFAANAQLKGENALAHTIKLTEHADFTPANPNRVRAVLGGLVSGNPEAFHRYDGEGYRFFTDRVLDMDRRNPQIAARLLGVFENWKLYDVHRQNLIKNELNRVIHNTPSANILEIATKCLGHSASLSQ